MRRLFAGLAVVWWLACSPPAAADPLNAAFLGDSCTTGLQHQIRAPLGSALVAQKMAWFEHQFSHGGNGYYRGDPNFLALTDQVAESHPDVVVVAGGFVDAIDPAYNPDAVAAAVFETYRALRDRLPNARIIAVGPTTPYSISARIVQVDADVQAAAGAVSAQYISLLVPPVITPDMVDSDGVHPNDAGHAAIADRILAAL